MTYEEALYRIRDDTIRRTGREPDRSHELQMHHETWAEVVHEERTLKRSHNMMTWEGKYQWMGFPVVLNSKMAEGTLALVPRKA
jgi:hypothetical protein